MIEYQNEEEREEIKKSSRHFTAFIGYVAPGAFGRNTFYRFYDIVNARIVNKLSGSNEFTIGGIADCSVDISVASLPEHDLTGKEVVFCVCTCKENEDRSYTEYKPVDVCSFICEKPKKNGSGYILTGFGATKNYMSAPYVSDLDPEEYTVYNVVSEALEHTAKTNINVDLNGTLSDIIGYNMYKEVSEDSESEDVHHPLDGLTPFEVISAVSQIGGGYTHHSTSHREGSGVAGIGRTIRFKPYSMTAAEIISEENIIMIETDDEATAVKGLISEYSGEKVESGIVDGSEGVFLVSNPVMDQYLANHAMTNLNGLSYTPCTIECLGNQHIECGDTIQIDLADGSFFKTIVMEHELYYDGGLTSRISSYRLGDVSEDIWKAPTTSRIEKLESIIASMLSAGNLMTKKGLVSDYGALIWHNGTNLWIGAQKTAGEHHSGSTYISSGSDSMAYISKEDPAGVRRNFHVHDAHNLQSGRISSVSANANSYTDVEVEFPYKFFGTPVVTACFYSTSTGVTMGNLSLSVHSVTTDKFVVRIFNNSTTNRSPAISWIAVGT